MSLVTWIVKMNSDALKDSATGVNDKEFLRVRSNLIVQGIMLAVDIKRTCKTMVLMHQKSGIQIKKDRIREIVQSVEMLKAIHIEFKNKKYIIN
jgi:predicted translin family RNA/ssDNA-binding protein